MRAAMLNSESYQTARPVLVRANQMISELFDGADLPASVADEPRAVTCRGLLDPSVDAAKMRDTLQHVVVGLVPATDRWFQKPSQLPDKLAS